MQSFFECDLLIFRNQNPTPSQTPIFLDTLFLIIKLSPIYILEYKRIFLFAKENCVIANFLLSEIAFDDNEPRNFELSFFRSLNQCFPIRQAFLGGIHNVLFIT